MRILVITNLYPTPDEPLRASFNREQFRELAARHTVKVIAPVLWTDELAARRRSGTRLPGNRRVERDGLVVEHPRYVFPPGILRSWYGHCFALSIRRTFARTVAEFAPDLVLASWAYPDGWAAVNLGRRAGLPVAIKVHGSDIRELSSFPGRRPRTAEALRRADAIIAVSRDLAEQVVGLGADPARVTVVHNGVDARAFHPGPRCEARRRLDLDDGPPIVLFVGHLAPVKGPDLLIDACAGLARDEVRVRCYVIGEGPMKDALKHQIARQGLNDRIFLMGSRDQAELADWYRAADVLALPSRSEGFPNVLLEALACGLPFVASRVGGILEIADCGVGRLVPVGDVEHLVESLRAAIAEARDRAAILAPALRSHTQVIDELEDVLRRLLLVSS